MINNGFQNPNDPDNSQIKSAIRQWLLAYLEKEQKENANVAEKNQYRIDINEFRCSDSGCLHTETILTVVSSENQRFFKIAKPLVFIRKWDFQQLTEVQSNSSGHQH